MREKKRLSRIIFAAICAVCAALMIIAAVGSRPDIFSKGAGYVFEPVLSFFTGVFDWCGGRINFLAHLSAVDAENRRLEAELDELKIEVGRLKYADEQAAELSKLLNVDRKYAEYDKLGARIIAKDPGNWYDAFTIDRGKDDGIEKNMVVLAAGGLAGRVVEAGKNYAKVVTLINDDSSISAKSAKTGDTGFVRGDYALMKRGLCLMEYMEADAEIEVGDEIVTSHLSSIYPPDITIGYVVELRSENGVRSAVIEPTVDFRYMDTVLIILRIFEHEMIE